jgi:hypothetical protein
MPFAVRLPASRKGSIRPTSRVGLRNEVEDETPRALLRLRSRPSQPAPPQPKVAAEPRSRVDSLGSRVVAAVRPGRKTAAENPLGRRKLVQASRMNGAMTAWPRCPLPGASRGVGHHPYLALDNLAHGPPQGVRSHGSRVNRVVGIPCRGVILPHVTP